MNKEISQLIALQQIDNDIAVLDGRIDGWRKELSAREQAIKDKARIIEEKGQRIKEIVELQRDMEFEREEAQTRIKDRQGKMMQVQTSREYQALLKEIGDNKQRITEIDDALLQHIEENESIAKEVEELNAQCSTEKDLLIEEADRVDKEVKKINGQRKKFCGERASLAEELRPNTFKRYDMLLGKRQGLAVTEVRNSVCQGCHMTIPPQQYNEILRGDQLHFCPTCLRILYYIEPLAVEGE